MKGIIALIGALAVAACSGKAAVSVADPETPVTNTTEFIFVTSLIESNGAGAENLLLFEKSSSSCSLTHINTYNVGADPYDLVYHRSTSSLYVANMSGPTISAFKFNTSTKQLTSVATVTQVSPPATTALPFMMAVHPNGFLYSVDGNSTTSSIGYFTQTQSTGAIAQFANPNEYLATGAGTRAWFIALTGNHVYVTDYAGNRVLQYNVNTTTGQLTEFGTRENTGTQPWSIFVHPTGNYVYTANSGAGTVSQFSRNTTTGQLSQIAAPLAAGGQTIGLAVGTRYLFAGGNGQSRIYQYSINQSTGALTAHGTPNPYVSTVRPNPYGLALSRDENCLYAAELTGNDGNSANDEIGIYSVSDGILTRQGSISGGIGPRFFALAY